MSAAYRAISTRRWTQTFIVIADYQVLTDRETADNVAANVREIVLDYLAAGLDPDNGR